MRFLRVGTGTGSTRPCPTSSPPCAADPDDAGASSWQIGDMGLTSVRTSGSSCASGISSPTSWSVSRPLSARSPRCTSLPRQEGDEVELRQRIGSGERGVRGLDVEVGNARGPCCGLLVEGFHFSHEVRIIKIEGVRARGHGQGEACGRDLDPPPSTTGPAAVSASGEGSTAAPVLTVVAGGDTADSSAGRSSNDCAMESREILG